MRKITNFTMPQGMINELRIGINDFQELERFSVSFNLMDINRLQSTIICLLKDSYVQQSQRYVKNTRDSFAMINVEDIGLRTHYTSLIDRTMDLYERMTEIKEESRGKSRTTVTDYKHGIPIEDARYILPLSAKTNMSVTMSGDKFGTFLSLLHQFNATIFKDLEMEMIGILEVLGVKHIPVRYGNPQISKLFAKNSTEIFSLLDNSRIEIDANGIDAICRGILMSTTADPSKKVEEKYPSLDDKQQLINRVAGYGHTSVLEQYRFNSIMRCSFVTFHQLIRHRMVNITPVNFDNIARMIVNRAHVTPHTIKKSQFNDEYETLVNDWRLFTLELVKSGSTNESTIMTLLNGDEVVFNYTTNIRADVELMNKRLCANAQWEIRELSKERLNKILDSEIGFIYKKFAKADCGLPKGCQEGAYSCNAKVREDAKKVGKKDGN